MSKALSDTAQGDAPGARPLVDQVAWYLKPEYGQQGNVAVEVAHRFDRLVSGVVVLARADTSLERLAAQFRDDGAKGIIGPEPGIHRMPPVHAAVNSERILTYEDVRALMNTAETFHVGDCIGRKEQDIAGHRACIFRLNNCMGFSSVTRTPVDGGITRVYAVALLDKVEHLPGAEVNAAARLGEDRVPPGASEAWRVSYPR